MGSHPPWSKTDSLLPLSRRADHFWYFQRTPAQLSNTIIRLSQPRGTKVFDAHGVAHGLGFKPEGAVMASNPGVARQKTRMKGVVPGGKSAHKPIAADNTPLGTDGFEFVEYAAPVVPTMAALFGKMGFSEVARHRSKEVVHYRQGDINFILNHEPHSFAQAFARVHGPSVCAFAIRAKDAAYSLKQATALGAKAYHGRVGPMELNIPAIRGIGVLK